jgi:hypothetical protein
VLRPSEGGAAAAVPAKVPTSLAALLTSHILRDGESVLLILKPSPWFIVFSSARVFAALLSLVLLLAVFRDAARVQHLLPYIETALFLLSGRAMWAVVQWMGRLYVLTDMRVLQLSGVFNIEVFDCPLRRIARVQIIAQPHESACRVGTIWIMPKDQAEAPGTWQTVGRPAEVREQIVAAMNRAAGTG